MEKILCDELLQEIFLRLSPPSSSAVPLVCKRWLRLYRSSKTSLSLRIPNHLSSIPSLSSFLSHYPYLSSLSLSTTITAATVDGVDTSTSSFSGHLLFSVGSSCPNLRNLRFLIGPVSLFSLLSLSTSCSHLTSLTITLSRPLSFHWLVSFHSLKDLSIVSTGVSTTEQDPTGDSIFGNSEADLKLENLCLSGIRADDLGLNWLWRSCKRVKRLKLRSCEGISNSTSSSSSFVNCLTGLIEVELRTCRTLVDAFLLKLAENCISLSSLLVYDGGSKEGLLQFINQSRCNLRKLDLRLPLDLDNSHLTAIAENFRGLSSLRLQSSCLLTGEGLKTIGLGTSTSNGIEELALINCDVVEREPGLLTTLGQNLRGLRILDLSYNEMLVDKEIISMLVSCNYLIELKLRGCKKLTNATLVSMIKNCKHLESVDIMNCCGIEADAIELFVSSSRSLRRVQVEERKVSDVARMRASNKFFEFVE